MISVIIPTLNAAEHLPRCLQSLLEGVLEGFVREVIISDGGSTDATVAIGDEAGCHILVGERGRGGQLRRGAAAARAQWFLILHADTALEQGWTKEVRTFIHGGAVKAGYFQFAPDTDDARARMLALMVKARCSVLALPYGDQGLLIPRALYEAVGGYRDIPLMEDVDIIRKLGRGRLVGLRVRAFTSVARHQKAGYAKRSLKNMWFLARFLLGADPNHLAKTYD